VPPEKEKKKKEKLNTGVSLHFRIAYIGSFLNWESTLKSNLVAGHS
jgi:hypothetical protein